MVYVLKMEYVSKINIFGLNMMLKSGLELNWGSQLDRLEKGLAHGGISKIFFLDHFSPSYLGQKY